jgi:hypothetical protein
MTLLWVTKKAREILHLLGWTKYFNLLQRDDTNFTLEFFQNLEGEISTVQGIQILVTSEIIAKVTGLSNIGIQWTGKYMKLREAMESFTELGEELDKKGKRLNPSTLSESWKELAGIVQRYITCDGWYDVIHPRHLKLLATLKKWLVLNLPFLLDIVLHEVTLRTQKSKDPVTVISHHKLVKLIVDKALSQTQLTWETLIEGNRPPQLEQATTTQREISPLQTEVEPELAQTIEGNMSPPQIKVEPEPAQTSEGNISSPQIEVEPEPAQTSEGNISPPQTEIEAEPTQIIEASRPPQLEQATTTQRETPVPQIEFEVDPAQTT